MLDNSKWIGTAENNKSAKKERHVTGVGEIGVAILELGMDFLRRSLEQRLDWGQEWNIQERKATFPQSKVMLFIGK